MARLALRWGKVAWVGLAASCVFGTVSCSDEDEPDSGSDAAADAKSEPRSDISVGTDGRSDTSVVDQREAGAPDASPDTSTPPDGGTPDGRAPDGSPDTGTPEGGNCVGGGDAARDGALGMALVIANRCANCHQDEPVDAGLILSGRLATIVTGAGVFPKNLTPDPATGLGCWTDDQIINAFMNGIDDQGQVICDRMPKFAGRLDGGMVQAQQIVDFLRTLPAINKPIPETIVCPPRPDPSPDGGSDAGDGGAPDGGSDSGTDGAAPPDGGTDGTSPPDGGPDSTAPDAGLDVVPDTGSDGIVSTDVDTDGG